MCACHASKYPGGPSVLSLRKVSPERLGTAVAACRSAFTLVALGCMSVACVQGTAYVDVPAGWAEIRVDEKFAFALPPGMAPVETRSLDSNVQRWEGQGLVVHFDYGRFSDPLTLYARKPGYVASTERIAGRTASVVSFNLEGRQRFTAVHFPDVGRDPYNQVLKLTLVVESSPDSEAKLPLQIIHSVRF